MKQYVVLQPFADKNNISVRFKVGDILPESFDEQRIENILNLGLAELVGDENEKQEDDQNANPQDGQQDSDPDQNPSESEKEAEQKEPTEKVEKEKKTAKTKEKKEK